MQRHVFRLAAIALAGMVLSVPILEAQIVQPAPYACTTPPNLRRWLAVHPAVANSIKWQVCYPFDTGVYSVGDNCKQAYPQWTTAEQQELVQAFDDSWYWYCDPHRWEHVDQGIAYPFTNVHPQVNDDSTEPIVWVDAAVARKLYIAWVAQNLMTEVSHHFPWSVANDSDDGRQVLFDSAAIMSQTAWGQFSVGSGNPVNWNYVLRKDNLGDSLIALPRWTYAFLSQNNLIGSTRLETIGRVLSWLTTNATHFSRDPYSYDHYNYANMEAFWQYRGMPPIERIVNGTAWSYNQEFRHWTAGCHGTTGFLRNVLRAANIPVQIVRACGHSQPYFITEGLYMDHGDDPYDPVFKASGLDPLMLLIDQSQYETWFGTDPNNHSNGCQNVGAQIGVLTGQP